MKLSSVCPTKILPWSLEKHIVLIKSPQSIRYSLNFKILIEKMYTKLITCCNGVNEFQVRLVSKAKQMSYQQSFCYYAWDSLSRMNPPSTGIVCKRQSSSEFVKNKMPNA